MTRVTITRQDFAEDPRDLGTYLGEYFDADNERYGSPVYERCGLCGENADDCGLVNECDGSSMYEVVFRDDIALIFSVGRTRSGELYIISENPSPMTRTSYMYVTKGSMVDVYGEDTESTREIAKGVLRGEIKELSSYFVGDVWGYTIEEGVHCECCGHVEYRSVDSCWGFYGDDESVVDWMVGNAGEMYRRDLMEAWENRED